MPGEPDRSDSQAPPAAPTAPAGARCHGRRSGGRPLHEWRSRVSMRRADLPSRPPHVFLPRTATPAAGFLGRACQRSSIVVARHADLALDAVVVDIAAADRAHAEIAPHAVRTEIAGTQAVRMHAPAGLLDAHLPRRNRAHRYVARDAANDEVARADAVGLDAAAHAGHFHVARRNGTDRDVAGHVAQAEIARADAADMRVTMHTIHAHVTGTDAGEIQASHAACHDIARTYPQSEFPGDAFDLEVARAERGIQRGGAADVAITEASLQLDSQ